MVREAIPRSDPAGIAAAAGALGMPFYGFMAWAASGKALRYLVVAWAAAGLWP